MTKDVREKECDLIMKGGLTSGVIYPALVSELLKEYRLKCIGGTSAGAIAASLAAAAETGYETGGPQKFDEIAQELQKPQFLLNLFQPDKQSKPLMELGLDIVEMLQKKKDKAYIWDALWNMFLSRVVLWGVIGAATGIFIWYGASSGELFWRVLACLIIVAAVGALFAVIRLSLWLWPIKEAILNLPKHGFGICSGRTDPDLKKYQGQSVLTDWLAEKLKACADIREQRPLTFGDIWRNSTDRKVDLQMFTSNLSQGRPYVFPLQDDEIFIFSENEFTEYFGEEVVRHMTAAYDSAEAPWKLPKGYHFFPRAEKFPVIVAARMSLSFPILFKAVPVYTVPAGIPLGAQIEEQELQKNWFSDGGICSNFPIHFFDAWLPDRPTFGVDIGSFDQQYVATGDSKSRGSVHAETREPSAPPDDGAVYMPKADDPQLSQFWEIKRLGEFVPSILGTATDCHDRLQSTLPSYRERIVQVRLKENEGGINLVMPKEVINEVIKKGKDAGARLNSFQLPPHQWVRMRVLLQELGTAFAAMSEVLEKNRGFKAEEIFNNQQNFPFSISQNEAKEFRECVLALHELMDNWLKKGGIPTENTPTPDPVLRVVPRNL